MKEKTMPRQSHFLTVVCITLTSADGNLDDQLTEPESVTFSFS